MKLNLLNKFNVNMLTLSTLYRYEKMKNLTSIEMFSVEITIEKNRKKKNVNFQNKCALVPKTAVIRKEEGATVAASPTFSAAKQCWLVS